MCKTIGMTECVRLSILLTVWTIPFPDVFVIRRMASHFSRVSSWVVRLYVYRSSCQTVCCTVSGAEAHRWPAVNVPPSAGTGLFIAVHIM